MYMHARMCMHACMCACEHTHTHIMACMYTHVCRQPLIWGACGGHDVLIVELTVTPNSMTKTRPPSWICLEAPLRNRCCNLSLRILRCMRLCGIPTTEARLRYLRASAALHSLWGYSRKRFVAHVMVKLLEDFMTCGATDRTDNLASEISGAEETLLSVLQQRMCNSV